MESSKSSYSCCLGCVVLSFCALSETTVNFPWDALSEMSGTRPASISLWAAWARKMDKFRKVCVGTYAVTSLAVLIMLFQSLGLLFSCFQVSFQPDQWAPATRWSELMMQKKEGKLDRTKWGQGPCWTPSCLEHRGPGHFMAFRRHIPKLFRHHINTSVNLSSARHAFQQEPGLGLGYSKARGATILQERSASFDLLSVV